MAGPANIQTVPSTMNASVNSAENVNKADAYEIGWLFVQQYFHFLNSSPEKLHLFYAPNSQLIHGSEGEDSTNHVGQQSIRDYIKSVGFSDCKVLITNCDVQSCSNDSILIQVMGEIENKDETAQRFVQTFCLYETQTGFSVGNDIFRLFAELPPLPSNKPVPESKPVKHNPSTQKATPVQPAVNKQVATSSDVNSQVEGANSVSTSKSTPKEPESVAPVVESKETSASSPANTDPNNTSPATTKSWANLVSKNTEKWGDKAAPVSGIVVAPSPVPGTSSPQSEPKHSQKDADSLNILIVKTSKPNFSSQKIHDIFVIHGAIKNIDFIKGSFQIEYQSPESVTKALAHGKITHNGDTLTPESRRPQYTHSHQGGRHGNSGNSSSHENRRGGGNNSGPRRNNHGYSGDHPSPDKSTFDKSSPSGGNRRGGNNSGRGGNRGNRQGHDGPSPK